MSAAIVRREVEAGQLRAYDRLVRAIHLAYHREREDSALIRAIRQVARDLWREGRETSRGVTARRARRGP